QPTGAVGAIAVAPSDPNVIYVGTGEPDPRGDISFGDGVYKSTDGGETWTNVGLKDTRHIGEIAVNPRDPDVVYVAALGHAFGPNEQRGVFRSRDGGKTWEKVLYRDENTGAVDLAMDPSNPRILYAALWQVRRYPYKLVNGGPGSGLYRSTDGGDTWSEVKGHGLPSGTIGRMSVDISGADGQRVYLLVNHKEKGGLYRSDDGGASWSLVNDSQTIQQRPWYYFRVYADPKVPNTVYVCNFLFHRSTDGGRSMETIRLPHVDNHALWIDPTDPDRMIEGNDGGATVTVDGGEHWSSESNQPTSQFYHIAADHRFPYYLYGAQQDRGSIAIASASHRGAITEKDWYSVAGGESSYVLPKPDDPTLVYAGSYFGYTSVFDTKTGQARDVSPWPYNPEGHAAKTVKYRFSWVSPTAFDPLDPSTLYAGSQKLLKTTDGGASWTEVSPDLTRDDTTKQELSGGPVTWDNVGAEYYDVIYTIAPSPVQEGVIWAGTDDGLVHLTRDGGKTWKDVTPKAAPTWGKVSLIEASHHDAGTAYAAVDAHKGDDFTPYIFRTHDYGEHWTLITDGIEAPSFARAVREDPDVTGLLYAGTEQGVYVSFDDGDHWRPLQLDLPATSVRDLVVRRGDLAIATHGRGFWVLDDIAPLRQWTAGIASAPAHLFHPDTAWRTAASGGRPPAPGEAVGENPPHGAILDWQLASAPKDSLRLDILKDGRVIRSYRNVVGGSGTGDAEAAGGGHGGAVPVRAGHTRFVWDLRYEGAPPLQVPGGPTFEAGGPAAPRAVPGDYQVRLTADGRTETAPLHVALDPRVGATQADLQAQMDLMMKLRQAMTDDHVAFNRIAGVREQLGVLERQLKDDASKADVLAAVKELDERADSVATRLFQHRARVPKELFMNHPATLNVKLASLQGSVDGADAAPTAQQKEVFQLLRSRLD
ncbi:MAG TPA: glycosyl hydrolase, partial [Gemmatimonadota bacterium]|nr:glycosyl hydrolase [Gemmatimonadota bacterium]